MRAGRKSTSTSACGRFRPARMKARREHRVPLSARAIAILKEMAEVRRNEFVFPGAKQGRPLIAQHI